MKTKTTLDPSAYAATAALYNLPAFQISDHPQVPGLARVLQIINVNIVGVSNQLLFNCQIHHYKNDVMVADFKRNFDKWVINKEDMTAKLGADMKPITNPLFDKTKPLSVENNPYEMINSYMQFTNVIINSTVNRKSVLAVFVDKNDNEGFYDED